MGNDKFCLECSCDGKPVQYPKGVHQEKNWNCPLLGGKICETCCEVELAAGMGAPDTLRDMVRKTGKSAAEIHATCVKCPNGGAKFEEPPHLIMMRGSSGEMVKSGPEFDAYDKRFQDRWKKRLNRLRGKK